jgi:hypothetical protein
MRRRTGWGAALAGVLLLAGLAVSRVEGRAQGGSPTVTVYKAPT